MSADALVHAFFLWQRPRFQVVAENWLVALHGKLNGSVLLPGSWARVTASSYPAEAKHPEDGTAEGSDIIRRHIIRVAERAIDDFAGSAVKQDRINQLLGLAR